MERAAGSLVGQSEALAAVRSFLDGPTPASLLIEGEPGMGKTALLEVTVGSATGTVLACRASAAESGYTLAALGDLLTPRLPDLLPELPPLQRRALRAALLLEGDEAPVEPRTLGVAVESVVRLLADTGPLLIAIDDLQWVDRGSLEALGYALRRLESEPVQVVATVRRDALDGAPLALEAPDLLPGPLTRVAPVALGETEIHELLRLRFGASLRRPALRRLHAVAAGNPLHTLEAASVLLAGTDDVALPRSALESLIARVAPLPDDTREALLVAALASDPDLDLLTRAAGARDPIATLGPAHDAGLVGLDGRRIRFRHPLVAAAAREVASASRRRAATLRLADVAPTVEERARHRAAASAPPDRSAAEALAAAAEDARLRGAGGVAADLFAEAVRFAPAGKWRDELVVDAAGALYIAGRGGEASELLGELVARLPAGGLRAAALLTLATVQPLDEARTAIATALADAAELPALRAQALIRLAFVDYLQGDWRNGDALLQRGLDDADPVPVDVALPIHALAAFVAASTGRWEPEAALRRTRELEAASHPLADLPPDMSEGIWHLFQDRLETARELLDGRLTVCETSGDDMAVAQISTYLADLEWRAGRWGRAERHAARARALGRQSGVERYEAMTVWPLAMLHAFRGRAAEALAEHDRGLGGCLATGVHDHEPGYAWIRGVLHLAAGDAAAAADVLSTVGPQYEQLGYREPGASLHAGDLLEALVAAGRLEEAERVAASERALGERLERPRLLGVAARGRGLVALARGNATRAVDELRVAVELHARTELPLDRARSHLALGRAQRRAGRIRDARASLEAAAATLAELGAPFWEEQARSELGRLGGRRTSGRELTAGERQVAELVAAGCTNREVAQRLVVTVSAVEKALSRAYDKLGVRSRAELARRFAQSPPP